MRVRPNSLLALLPALLVACGPAEVDVASTSSPVSASAVDPGNAGGNKLVTVMSQNLYLGAELGPAMQPGLSDLELVQAATGIWAMVQKNDFDVRAKAIANEIAAAGPELVGLQEAYLWTFDLTPPASPEEATPRYDYVRSLIEELAARGLVYRAAVTVPLFSFQAAVFAPEAPSGLGFVGIQDRGVILAREDVTTRNPQAHTFSEDHLLPVPVGSSTLLVKRGWVSVEVKHQGEWFTFASTHLEAYHWYYRWLQAQDLAGDLAEVPGSVILVGDLNSDPLAPDPRDALAYGTLVASGLRDSWPVLHPDDPGYTSPYNEDLTIEEIHLDERIDHVLVRGPLTPRAEGVVGTALSDRVGGLWPSDHAGLWATIRLEDPKFYVLR